jgi:hypothetical protein
MAESTTKYYKDVFPSPIAPDEEKKTKAYGLQVGKSIYSTAMLGGSGTSYYASRNIKFQESRVFANGKQPFQTYLDLLGVNGKNSFINLDYHPRPIAPKFRDILVNSIMERLERVECTGLSLNLKQRKQDKKNDAAFRMKEGEFIKGLQQEAGVEFEDPNAFVPSTEEELDLWSELNDKEREELLMEEAIQFVLYNNDWESIKKELAGDLIDTAMAWAQDYFDGCNRIRVRRVKPEMMVYGPTNTLDFRGAPYMAHVERMSITDVRAMWSHIPEKELYELCRSSIGLYGNPNDLVQYNTDFTLGYTRPYDSFVIDVLFYEYRVTKYVNILKSKDKNGNKITEYPKAGYKPTAEDKQLVKKPIPTIYAGAYLIGSDIVGFWGEQENLLRNNEDVEDLRFSYSGYMLNNDGTMLPKSPIDAMKSSIIQMDLAILKIQQHIAGAAPDGARIDIDSAVEIDLGQGIGTVGAMKLREIRMQTGDEYWSSSKQSGEQNRPAIEQAVHNMGDKISQFISVYNFELNNIRDYIGVNEVKDGSGVNPRIGLQVMNNQIQASNTATAHIYGGYVKILENKAKNIAARFWDTMKSADVNSMYVKLLGQKNSDFIKYRKDITDSNYDVMISVDMSQDDKQFLEMNIQEALKNKTIQLQDAVYIRKVPNLEKAVRYLAFVEKKRKKEAMDEQLEIQNNAQKNQGDIVAAQNKRKAEDQMKMDELEISKTREKGSIEGEHQMQKLINDALLKSMDENTKPIPAYVQALIDKQMAQEEEALLQQQEEEMMMAEQEQMMAEQGMEMSDEEMGIMEQEQQMPMQ